MNYFASTSSFHTDNGWLILLIFGVILFCVFFFISLPVVLVAAIARRSANKFMKEREGTVIALYEPPLQLAPAELGMLYDLRCDKNELQATLFDLNRRNIITLSEARAATVTSQEAYDALEEFEKIAVNATRTSGSVVKDASPFAVTVMVEGKAPQVINFNLPPAASMNAFRRAVRKSLQNKGYQVKSFGLALFIRSLALALAISLWPVLFMAFAQENGMTTLNNEPISIWSLEILTWTVAMILLMGIFLFPVYLLTALAITALWAKLAGRSWLSNKKIRSVWPQLEGYRLYLDKVELDRVQFESSDPYDDPITKALPYAIVYNLQTKWQARFEQR